MFKKIKSFIREILVFFYHLFKKNLTMLYFYLIEKPSFLIWKMRHKEFKLACLYPFYDCELVSNGNMFLCCPGWVQPFGNFKKQNINEAYNNVLAQRFRMSIYKNTFKYCDLNKCTILHDPDYKMLTETDIKKNSVLRNDQKDAILKRKNKIGAGPSRITDGISVVCNLRCSFCSIRPSDIQSCKNEIDYLLNYIVKKLNLLKIISFSGGECFIQKYVIEIMNLAVGTDLQFNFTTNLNYLNDEIKNLLKQIKIGVFHVSINAVNENIYEELIVRGNFSKMMNNFHWILELKKIKDFQLNISAVVTKLNLANLDDFIKFGLSHSEIDKIILYPMNQNGMNQNLEIDKLSAEAALKALEHSEFVKDKRVIIESLITHMKDIV